MKIHTGPMELDNIVHLKRHLEEAEIIRSGVKLVLMNPALDSERKGEYEETFLQLNDEIRRLKILMGRVRKIKHSLNTYKRGLES